MTRLERAALENPALYAFGTGPLKRLSAAEEAAAPFEGRLQGVWGYLVRRARAFRDALPARDRALIDVEDLVEEFVLALLSRDAKWDARRGRYVTFAEAVIKNVLIAQRERAGVVRAPANARGRLRRYREADAGGTLTPARARTMRAIDRALDRAVPVPPDPPALPAAAASDDDRAAGKLELIEALKGIESPVHALVLARSFGLFGTNPCTPGRVGDVLPGRPDAAQVEALRAEAQAALRGRIESLRRRPKP